MFVAFVLLAYAVMAITAKQVTISNVKPRTDGNGNIIDAHDGSYTQFVKGGPFYYYAMGYGLCKENGKIYGCNGCGNHDNNTVGIWTSMDLSMDSWRLVGQARGSDWPNATYYRSHVLYNPNTKEYVLWVNAEGSACKLTSQPRGSCYVVATATQPQGPFKYVGATSPPANLGSVVGNVGDFALLADSSESGKSTGYILLTHLIAGAGHRDMYVLKLADNFTTITSEKSTPLSGPDLVEAPIFMKYAGFYYAFVGGCDCFGLYGSGVSYSVSTSPMGPYIHVTSMLDPGCNISAMSTCFEIGPNATCNPVMQAQQNYIIKYQDTAGDTNYIWTGDRWQTAPDGLKGHDPQSWAPLEFVNASSPGQPPKIKPLVFLDSFIIDIDV